MHYSRLYLVLPVIVLAAAPPTIATSQMPASASTGPRGGAWKLIAPHIQVAFSQVGRNACTWRFRNGDDARTLESMRFSFTYSTLATSPSPTAAGPALETGNDVLNKPLAPLEVSDERDYQLAANCATVNIHVIDSKWV